MTVKYCDVCGKVLGKYNRHPSEIYSYDLCEGCKVIEQSLNLRKECRYNVGVICANGPERCRRCGWDPKVSAKRKRDYREASRPLYRSGMIIKFKEERT